MAEPVTSSMIGKVVDLLFGVAKEEISYLCNCSENVENYKKEVDKLSSMKRRVQQHIDLARSKGEVVLEGVEEWMKKADACISGATQFPNEEEAHEKCFNLCNRRRCSKTAIKRKKSVQEHQEDGKNFEACVSLPAQAPRFTDLYQSKNLENIDTHKSILEEIIRAIEDETVQIVGISGLGGVGKTTLASEVAKKMKNQFEDIVFVTVSQTVDAEKIKKNKEVENAASRIINKEKVLIILDDVWKELELKDLGIPCGSEYMNCKILLTSRNIDVCVAMNANKNISVNPLRDEEAWNLFERVVGKSEWDDRLKEVALEIVEECGGLPLFIHAVGKALKDKGVRIWEAALRRLQDPTDEDLPFKREGIMQLKLSYDFLEDEVVKSCFLLCSMYPEDRLIDLESLTHYGLALGILNNPRSIYDAKDKVRLAVESLKSSSLILWSSLGKVQMHDLVRDMALCVTSEGDDKFLVESGIGLREWQPKTDTVKKYKKISLMENEICKLPDYELDLPLLDTFLVPWNELSVVPDEFFRGMKVLKLLDMSDNRISFLPRSLNQLTILRLLDLSGNESLCEISILGELTCLEILKLRRTGIINIPEEIGLLTNLKLLDVYDCYDLSHVTPGVISKLIRLEELYLELKEGNCNFLAELTDLTLLKVLHLTVLELHRIPKIETLIEFKIGTSDEFPWTQPTYKRCLCVSGDRHPLPMPLRKLIQQTEGLKLSHIEALENILPDLYQEGFDELVILDLSSCDNVRSLVKTCDPDAMQTSNEHGPMKTNGKFFSQVEEIKLDDMKGLELLCDNPHQYISFCKLGKIIIRQCPSLSKLFPLSVAQGLVNLTKLIIVECVNLVTVISNGGKQTTGSEIELAKQDHTDIVFPRITFIILKKLFKLESFYSDHSNIKYPSLKSISVFECRSMKRWSCGENHIPNIKLEHQGRECSINDYIAGKHEMSENFKMTASEMFDHEELELWRELFYQCII